MQQVTRKKLGAGVNLTCVTTPKFKRAVLRVMLLLPLGGPDGALRACLPQVLRRGTAHLPDLRAIGEGARRAVWYAHRGCRAQGGRKPVHRLFVRLY